MYKLLKKWPGLERTVAIDAGSVCLEGYLCLPENARALVLFVHGSGSSRHSQRNQFVANLFNEAGLGTLLFDLLSAEEEAIDLRTGQLRFNIEFLCQRVEEATKWLSQYPETARLAIGYFGASTGAAAALASAACLSHQVKAVVSRGGRPDLAVEALPYVLSPTLFIVGERDPQVVDFNLQALRLLPADTEKALKIVPGATHLFEENGALEKVATLSCEWFKKHMLA